MAAHVEARGPTEVGPNGAGAHEHAAEIEADELDFFRCRHGREA
jgi:hypothetical protein